jgi:hypothetical protein
MSAKKFLSIVLLACVVVLAAGSSTTFALPKGEEPDPPDKTGLIQPTNAEAGPAAVQAPPPLVGGFIDIKVDDVNNYNPAVAYNSIHDEYLVVWENDRGATRDIYAQRVAGDGTLKSWFTIVHDANKWNYLPDVAYSPAQDEYLIVYTYQYSTSDYDIYARRVKWNGADMNQPQYQEFAINNETGKQWYPAVTYNSQRDEYLVVYENYWSSTLHDIDAMRVRASDGYLFGAPSGYNIASGANTIRRLPDVAYNEARNEYLIAYTYQHTTNGDIWGKIASFNFGTLSSEIHLVDNTVDQDGVALAAGPDEYLAVWNDGGGTTIYGVRVTGAGATQSFIPLATDSGQTHVEPDVAYGNIYGYLVTWRYVSPGNDVYGRFVKAGQNTPWGGRFAIDNGAYSQRSPALACGTHGDCLVVEEDNWPLAVDYEIRGRFVLAHHVYLPLVMRN